jgi:hypothetical protein
MRKTIIQALITVCFTATALFSGGLVHPDALSSQGSVVLTSDNIRDAQKRISGQIVRTPFLYSRLLSKLTGVEVYVKMENLQATGAFTERGAFVKRKIIMACFPYHP